MKTCETPEAAQEPHLGTPASPRGCLPRVPTPSASLLKGAPRAGFGHLLDPNFQHQEPLSIGNTKGFAEKSLFKNRASLYVLLLCFSSVEARVSSGAGP